jgi:hypothetical protein
MTSSRPSRLRTISARFAHGHAYAAARRYRPGSTGHVGTETLPSVAVSSSGSADIPTREVIRSGM